MRGEGELPLGGGGSGMGSGSERGRHGGEMDVWNTYMRKCVVSKTILFGSGSDYSGHSRSGSRSRPGSGSKSIFLPCPKMFFMFIYKC